MIRDVSVRQVIEKPSESPGFTYDRIFSLGPAFLDFLGDETEIPNAINAMIAAGTPLKAVPAEDWQDAIYPWDLLRLNAALLQGVRQERAGRIGSSVVIKGQVSIGRGTTIGPNSTILGPVVIGEDCEIGPNCVVLPETSIGDRVRIEPFTLIGHYLIPRRRLQRIACPARRRCRR